MELEEDEKLLQEEEAERVKTFREEEKEHEEDHQDSHHASCRFCEVRMDEKGREEILRRQKEAEAEDFSLDERKPFPNHIDWNRHLLECVLGYDEVEDYEWEDYH